MPTQINVNDLTLGDLIQRLEADPAFAAAKKLKGYIHLFIKDDEYHGIILEKFAPSDLLQRLRGFQLDYGGQLSLSGSVSYGG